MTRINYTGRKRILREQVRLRVRQTEAGLMLDILSLALESLHLVESAHVLVEAYRQTTYQRISAGTVGRLELPTGVPLARFPTPEAILFRVKVVGTGDQEGKILASADQLRASIDDADTPQSSLLAVEPRDLGQVLWKVDLTDENPVLVVNNRVGDWKGFTQQPVFSALVLPEVLRQIAVWVYEHRESLANDEDSEGPLASWAEYLANLGYQLEDAGEDRGMWADEIVSVFSRRHRFRELIRDITGEISE